MVQLELVIDGKTIPMEFPSYEIALKEGKNLVKFVEYEVKLISDGVTITIPKPHPVGEIFEDLDVWPL